ncbi:hypothetical protein MKX36_22825 [Paenibacillus sp. FSL W8-0439]
MAYIGRKPMRAALAALAVGDKTKPCATGTGFCFIYTPHTIAGGLF